MVQLSSDELATGSPEEPGGFGQQKGIRVDEAAVLPEAGSAAGSSVQMP